MKNQFRTYSLDTLTDKDKRNLHFVATINDALAIRKSLLKNNIKFTAKDLNLLAHYLNLYINKLQYLLLTKYFSCTDRTRLEYIITYNKIIDIIGDDYTGKVGHIPERMYIDYIEQRQAKPSNDI